MQSQQLERIKSQHPRLRPQIEALANYIAGALADGRTRIVPALAATALKVSEAETLALLMLFEDAGLIHHEYDVVCPRTHAVLITVSDKMELEDAIPAHCQLCDTEHKAEDLRVELVFEVLPSATHVFQQHAFA